MYLLDTVKHIFAPLEAVRVQVSFEQKERIAALM